MAPYVGEEVEQTAASAGAWDSVATLQSLSAVLYKTKQTPTLYQAMPIPDINPWEMKSYVHKKDYTFSQQLSAKSQKLEIVVEYIMMKTDSQTVMC